MIRTLFAIIYPLNNNDLIVTLINTVVELRRLILSVLLEKLI